MLTLQIQNLQWNLGQWVLMKWSYAPLSWWWNCRLGRPRDGTWHWTCGGAWEVAVDHGATCRGIYEIIRIWENGEMEDGPSLELQWRWRHRFPRLTLPCNWWIKVLTKDPFLYFFREGKHKLMFPNMYFGIALYF